MGNDPGKKPQQKEPSALEKMRGELTSQQLKRYDEVDKMLGRMEAKDVDRFRNYELFKPQLALRIKEYIHQKMLPAWTVLAKEENRASKIEKRGEIYETSQEEMDKILEELNKATGHLDEEFLPYFWQILTTYGKDEKGVDLMDTYKMAVGAKGILDAFEKGYKEIHQKILDHEELTKAETQKLIQDIRPLIENGQKVAALEALRRSGPWLMIQSMDSAQRYHFTEKFIKARPQDAENFLHGLVAGGLLELPAMKRLWKKDWGECPVEEMRQAQYDLEQEARRRQENLESSHDDTNQMVALFRPKTLLGVGLQIWGGIEVVLNGATMLFKKDWGGFVSNPYFIGGAGAVLAGRSLTHKGSAVAFLQEKSAHQKEQEQYAQNKERIAALMLRYDETYAAIDTEALMELIQFKRENNKNLEVSLTELIAKMEEKNGTGRSATPSAAYAEKIASLRALEKNKTAALQITEMLGLIAQTPVIAKKEDLDEFHKEVLEKRGLA